MVQREKLEQREPKVHKELKEVEDLKEHKVPSEPKGRLELKEVEDHREPKGPLEC